MALMITKLYTTHVVVYVQILSKLHVVFAEIRPIRFGFGAYVKALIGIKAF